jgi:hypothetical protein
MAISGLNEEPSEHHKAEVLRPGRTRNVQNRAGSVLEPSPDECHGYRTKIKV